MTISRVELQGQVTRAQDFTTLKQNEDNKGMVDQVNFQRQFDQTVENKLHQVRQGEKAENEGKRFDAKEKGNGHYAGDGGRDHKKEKDEKGGRVILKNRGGFDIKV